METVLELYQAVRDKFPELTIKADREHKKTWGEPDPEFSYSWFHSLADALNSEMNRGVPYSTYATVFSFINGVLPGCSQEIFKCIDVSFVENLFWQVPRAKAGPYWQEMPNPLKELYVGFHHRTPL